MSGRHGRGVPDNRDPQAATDIAASAVATSISGLCWRLRQQEVLEHPKVLSALRKLQDQVDGQLAYADQSLGRHRSAAGNAVNQQINQGYSEDPKEL
jgi:hypothetical protein